MENTSIGLLDFREGQTVLLFHIDCVFVMRPGHVDFVSSVSDRDRVGYCRREDVSMSWFSRLKMA